MRFLPSTRGFLTLWIAVGVAAAAFVVAATGPAESATPLTRSQLGMYVGFDEGGRFDQAERDLGVQLGWVVTMAGKRSPSDMTGSMWGQFGKPTAYLPKVSDRVNVVASVPVAFGESALSRTKDGQQVVGDRLRATARGVHDGAFQTVARYLVDAGYDDAVIRLGHEFDGTYEPYSARGNNAEYIAAYRRAHDVLSSESSRFRFEWTSMRSNFVEHGPPAYPGDAYVDIVGLDIYWREDSRITDRKWTGQYEPVLRAHRDFAVSRGKPVAYSEWGRALSDTSRFVDLMYGWFTSLPASGPGRLVYQSYFNPVGQPRYDLANLPKVRSRYLLLFGDGNVVADRGVAPVTPADSTESADSPAPAASSGSATPGGAPLPDDAFGAPYLWSDLAPAERLNRSGG